MNNRMVSLPDLMSGKKHNSTLSLTEGFTGAGHQGSLLASAQNFAPKRGYVGAGDGNSNAAHAIASIAPLYYRQRQSVLDIEKAGRRVPQRVGADLRAQEQAMIQALRPLHPLLFQRLDNAQMDRLLRSMPFLRLSQGRWVFGGENDAPDWGRDSSGRRAFLLIVGKVSLFADGHGSGNRQDIYPGEVFGEAPFSVGDESVQALVAGAAHCQEPCIVGALTIDAMEAAFADRAFGNTMIGKQIKTAPALARVVQGPSAEEATGSMHENKESKVVTNAITELSKAATKLHVRRGKELEVSREDKDEEGVVMVTQGRIEVRGDVTLTEKVEGIPPKKMRLRVYLEKAENLAGDSFFDKLDPYCIVKLGNFKRFQTPIQWNVGPNPIFDHTGVLTYNGEQTMEFVIMDHDTVGADDLCGQGEFNISEIGEQGLIAKIPLSRPKRGIFAANAAANEEDCGDLTVKFMWDLEKVSSLQRQVKSKTWRQQELFTLKDKDCWGHEQLALGEQQFRKVLQQAASKLKYNITLENFHLVGSEGASGVDSTACLKVASRRFMDFIKKCGREKQFLQGCRMSVLDKQLNIKDLAVRLTNKWEDQVQAQMMRQGADVVEKKLETMLMEPSHFRITYRGCQALVSVRNALNLSGSGWFDKADPYAIVRFRGSNQEFRTSVLQDAGSDPIWNCDGYLKYSGETTLEISVWDYDKYTADDLLAIGSLQVESFCNGFEGMVPLNPPTASDKKKKKRQVTNQSMLTIGIQWPPLEQLQGGNSRQTALDESLTGAASFLQAGMLTMGSGA